MSGDQEHAPLAPTLHEWNEALATRFFRTEMAGRQVFLFATGELLDEVASTFSLTHSDFVRGVAGLPGSERARLVAQRAVNLCSNGQWRKRSSVFFPPYVAHLCLFVYAAGIDEVQEMAGNSYYPKLRRVLGLPETGGAITDFDELSDRVWTDLEQWSVHDTGGDYGVFRRRVYGMQRHVGVPRSQTLITETEINDLPNTFARALLDPASPPSDRLLVETLERASEINAKTRKILNRATSDDMRQALLEVVRDELTDWDGTIRSDITDTGQTFGSLHLCIEPDAGYSLGHSYLRCSIGVTFPEDGVQLDGLTGGVVTCEEMSSPWSTRFMSESALVDAAVVNWVAGLNLEVIGLGWKVRSRRAEIRIFEEGSSHGLPGWLETNRLRKDRPMLIAYPEVHSALIGKWAATCAESYALRRLEGALPVGWLALTVSGVSDVGLLGSLVPNVGFTDHVSLQFVGGLRTGTRSRYLSYGAPSLALAGAVGDEEIWANDVHLIIDNDGVCRLPDLMTTEGEQIELRVLRNNEELAHRTLSFDVPVRWSMPTFVPIVNAAGIGIPKGPGITGAIVDRELVEGAPTFETDLVLPVTTAELIGRNRGELSEWPEDGIPPWKVIWAIGSPSRGRAHKPVMYCGTDPSSDTPGRADPRTDRKLLHKWDYAVRGQRKRLVKPVIPSLASLWYQYECAGK
jgi:hypothetical protein